MGSKTFNGVSFFAYSKDHDPPHVHGFYAGVEAIIELVVAEGGVRLATRKDARRPRNAKRSDVQHILRSAKVHFKELLRLWEEA